MLKVLIAITAIQAILFLINATFGAIATVRSFRFKKALTCEDCEKHTEIYMLRDECWHVIATRNGREKEARILCLRCAEKRWGRSFEEPDFSPAPCNDSLRLIFEKIRPGSVPGPVGHTPGDQKKPEENATT